VQFKGLRDTLTEGCRTYTTKTYI